MYNILKTVYFSVPMASFVLFFISLCAYICSKIHNKHRSDEHIVQMLDNLKMWLFASSVFFGAMMLILTLFYVALYISAF